MLNGVGQAIAMKFHNRLSSTSPMIFSLVNSHVLDVVAYSCAMLVGNLWHKIPSCSSLLESLSFFSGSPLDIGSS